MIPDYLKRLGYEIIELRQKALSERDAWTLLEDRFGDQEYKNEILDHFMLRNTYFYYVVKSAAQEEISAIIRDEDPCIEDIFEIKELKKPFLPGHFPYLFLAMDTPEMFEAALSHIYPDFRNFWGKSLEAMNE